MNLQLENKLALVSGSTAGIGFAIAKVLAAEGARVVVNGRTEARVDEAMASIRVDIPSAKLEELAVDLSKTDGAAEATKRYPDVDILVNNLGVYEVRAFEQITDAEWAAIIETNFLSGVRLSRHYLPRMKTAGWGRIIFISSESAVNIPKEMIHYGVTKTMQVALARGLAETTAGTGVTVNSVLAGPTRSEGVEKFLADIAKTKKRHDRRSGTGVLSDGETGFALATVCQNGRSGGVGCVRRQPVFLRDKRRGVARGRRCRGLNSLIDILFCALPLPFKKVAGKMVA